MISAIDLLPTFNSSMPWLVNVQHVKGTPLRERILYPTRPLADPFIKIEVRAWCEANLSYKYELLEKQIYFVSEEDALLFLMTFK